MPIHQFAVRPSAKLDKTSGRGGASSLKTRCRISRGLRKGIGGLAAASIAISPVLASPLPTGGSVAEGSAAIVANAPSGHDLLVSQTSHRAIINWQGFSVGDGRSVHFDNGAGATLNRVTGGAVSSIDGVLSGTGSVFLVNPNGVVVGSGGIVDVGGSFVASALDVGNANFMTGGDLVFSGESRASVVNYGRIGALGGDVALIGARVENHGSLNAPQGNAALAAGHEVLMRDAALADGKFVVRVGGADTLALNTGDIQAAEVELRANQGNVLALAGNTNGVIRASGVASSGGRVFLTAPDGSVRASQTIRASRPTASPSARDGGEVFLNADAVSLEGLIDVSGLGGIGGSAVIEGTTVALAEAARIDASGTRGGTILVGGDYKGGAEPGAAFWRAPLVNATTTTIARGASLVADGGVSEGGHIVVWSDDRTDFAGAISARGAGDSDGGFAEVSGKRLLSFTGTADLTAENGRFGTLLLDPYNVTITGAPDASQTGFVATGDNSIINVTTLVTALATANVTVTTGSGGAQDGDIFVLAPVTWSAPTTLTLAAHRNIQVDVLGGFASVNGRFDLSGGANLVLRADATGTGVGTVSFSGTSTIDLAAGSSATIFFNPTGDASTVNADKYATLTDFSGRVSGAGTLNTRMLVNNVFDLQNIRNALSGHFALGRDIDASGTAAWNTGAGFAPLGNSTTAFSGSLDGQGHVISGLTINRPGDAGVGLFGYTQGAMLTGIGLLNIDVRGLSWVGGLVGTKDSGSVAGSSASGTVSGFFAFGGLVGRLSSGSIDTSWASASVTGSQSSQYGGGLVGYQISGSIATSWASGSVTGNQLGIGGLVGVQEAGGSITTSWASGSVNGPNSVGGLVGFQSGSVSQSWASGRVTGAISAGGLAGFLSTGGSVTSSFWDIGTTGRDATQGVGSNSGTFGATGLATDLVRTRTSYEPSFNFAADWFMIDGETRPLQRAHYSTTIQTPYQLQLMAVNLGASYTLARDIDIGAALAGVNYATAGDPVDIRYPGIWGAAGFVPVGNATTEFAGSLDGQGRVISGLSINRPATDNVGLFGSTRNAMLAGIGLADVDILGNAYTGGLVGLQDGGSISASWVGGTVTGSTFIGGLVGSLNGGSIAASWASGAVRGGNSAGGLAGLQFGGSIMTSWASVAVTGDFNIGGLLGWQFGGSVANSWASGAVTGFDYTGGLVGFQFDGSIATAWASGLVTSGSSRTGGLVGSVDTGGSVLAAYWDTDTTGRVAGVGGNSGTFSAIGLTTSQFQDTAGFMTRATAAGWNFETTWAPSSPGFYPVLYATSPVIRLDVANATRPYGDANPSAVAAGIYGGPDINVFGPSGDSLAFTPTLAWNATTAADVGIYGATGPTSTTSLRGRSYRVVYTGALTITPATLGITANDIGKVYGDADPALTFAASGFKNGDDESLLTGALSRAAGESVAGGPYAIGQGTLAASANYTIAFTGGALTITPATLNIAANDISKIFGDADPALTFAASGFKNGDDESLLTGALSRAAGETVAGGPYAIGQGTLAASANYTIAFTGGRFSITPATLGITANDLGKIYGDTDPALTFTANGFKLTDDISLLTGALSRAVGENVAGGPYAIGQGTLAANANYTIAFTGGRFSITPRAISLRADDKAKLTGQLDPAFTWSFVSGRLIGGDVVAGALARDPGEFVGSYPIRIGSLDAGTNYVLSFSDGRLTIAPARFGDTAFFEAAQFGNPGGGFGGGSGSSPGTTASTAEGDEGADELCARGDKLCLNEIYPGNLDGLRFISFVGR